VLTGRKKAFYAIIDNGWFKKRIMIGGIKFVIEIVKKQLD